MKKTITALFLIQAMIFSLTACGSNGQDGGSASGTDGADANLVDSVSTDSGMDGAGTDSVDSHSTDSEPSMGVYIYDEVTADINIYHVDGNSTAQGREWSVSFGDYKVSLQDFGQEEPQCSVWKMNGDNGEFVAMAQSSFDGDMLRFNVSMSEVPGFSFGDITSYTLYVNEDGRGGPKTEFAAADVVQQNSIGGENVINGDTSVPLDKDNGDKNTDGKPANNDTIDLSVYISGNGGEFIPYRENSDSFTLVDKGNGVYQFTNMNIASEIYQDGQSGANEMSTTFTASDCVKDGDTFVLEFTTNYGCTGKAVFYDNKDIELNLFLGDKSYTMKFC